MADPTKQFVIETIRHIEIPGTGIDISFTNSAMWMVTGAVIAVSLLMAGLSNKSIIPGRLQLIAEGMHEFVSGMVRENLGAEGRRYFPFIFTLFVFVLMGNLLGMVPYSFTYTSHIIVTLALALIVFFMVTIIGIARNGLSFFSLFCPPGVPFVLKFLVVPIEVLSFLIRPVTLSVRLFANMMAGHLMLKVFAGFSVMLLGLGTTGLVVGILPTLFNAAFIAFEFLIAFVQAYVFALLSCVYLKDTLDAHH